MLRKEIQKISKAIPGVVGKGVAAMTGVPMLEGPVTVATSGLGRVLNDIVCGHGAYQNGVVVDPYTYNSLWTNRNKSPHFQGESKDYMRVKGSITLSDTVLPASGTYTRTFPLSPNMVGMPDGRNFAEWKPVSMFVEVESSVGAGTSGAEGMFTIFWVPNPNMPVPSDYASAIRFSGALEARFDKSALFGIECEGSNWLMCREGGSDTTDKINTDYGYLGLYCAPSAALASQRVSRLTLHYVVDYRFTKSNPDFFGYAHITSGNFTSASPLGVTNTVNQAYGSLIGITASQTVITLTNVAVGQSYLLTYIAVCAATAAVTPPTVTLSGANGLNVFSGNTLSSRVSPQIGATSGNVAVDLAFNITDITPTAPTITFSAATLPGSPSTLDVFLTPLPQSTSASLL